MPHCAVMSSFWAPERRLSRLQLRREIEPVLPRRDIKPENIFFDDDNNLRLGDFGLAINETRERPTARVGTLDFMAPEARCLHAVPCHALHRKNEADHVCGYHA